MMGTAGGSEERGSHRWRPLEKSWSSHLERKIEIIQAGLTGVHSQVILGGRCSRSRCPCCLCPSKHEPTPKISSWKMGRSTHKWLLLPGICLRTIFHMSNPIPWTGTMVNPAPHTPGSVPGCTTNNPPLLYTHRCYFRFPIFHPNSRQLFPLGYKNKKAYSA